MRTNERSSQTWSAAACVLALLAVTAGAALAAVPSTTAYHFSSHPMISGTVVTVNDREMVVDTDQGEQVTLAVDSRTMAPRDLAPGMVMRAEFLALPDCHFYAQRIVAIRGGMSTNRFQAYANTRDSREAIVRNASAYGSSSEEHGVSYASAESRESLPQTVGEHSSGTVMTATPTTADYQFSTRSMVSGRVVSVNDHQLVVVTDQGQQVGLAMDSRTLVPGEVAPGSLFRAEFSEMQDGRFYAKRIHQIGSGVADREQAYAHTRDSDLVLARNTSDCGCATAAPKITETAAVEPPQPVAQPEPVVAQSVPEPVAEAPETLPQTASNQPLILLFGLIALGAAGAVAIGRRLFTS